MFADCFCLPTHYNSLTEAVLVIVFCLGLLTMVAKEILFPKDED